MNKKKINNSSTDIKNLELVSNICALIENNISNFTASAFPPSSFISLDSLAQKFSMSPSHLQKVFKKITGVTPKSYELALKQKAVKSNLDLGESITSAIYDSNHSSNSRFYESSNSVLGMTPSQYKKGAPNLDITLAVGQCSLGSILVAQTSKGICSILLGDNPQSLIEDVQKRFPKANFITSDKSYESVMAKVVGFIDLTQPQLDLPLHIIGTAFELKVWKALASIPLGETVDYSSIAKAIGAPQSFRAVANACGKNKIAVAIPCHRVVQKNGNVSGYRWGIERKKTLLNNEAIKGKTLN